MNALVGFWPLHIHILWCAAVMIQGVARVGQDHSLKATHTLTRAGQGADGGSGAQRHDGMSLCPLTANIRAQQ